jgi:3-oxoacyl-[acyl-carrier-protein] synthase I
MKPSLFVFAHGICCAIGHHAAAAVPALRARMNHFRETEFIDESGMPLVGASLYDVDVWGAARQRLMFDAILNECSKKLPAANNNADTAILLLSAEIGREGPWQHWAQRMLADVVVAEQFHPASRALPLGKAGIGFALVKAHALLHAPQAPVYVIIAGVDTWLDAASVEAMLAQERLASTANSDGFIPGEAGAAVIVCLAQPGQAGLLIEGIGEAQETAFLGGEEANRAVGLTTAVRRAAQDANCQVADLNFHASGASGESWYFNEIGLMLARVLERRVASFSHQIVSQFVGEVGAATGPLVLAWMSQVMARADGPGQRGLAHFSNDDGRRAALILRYHQ